MKSTTLAVISLALLVVQCATATQSITATDQRLFYQGRTQQLSSTEVQFDWPGIEIHIQFRAQSVSALFTANGSTFNVIIDNQLVQILNTTSSQKIYTLGDNLDVSKTHYLRLTKRTEPLVGVTTFGGLILKGGDEQFLAQPPLNPVKRVEWIGDSITAGYGNEGTTPSCPFTPATENNLKTYEVLTSSALGYEWHVEAWSGKGVVRNYGDKNITSTSPTLPVLYPRAVASQESSSWNFSRWVPDVVVVNLGTNDYSTAPIPPQDIFVNGYKKFVHYIDAQYKAAGSLGLEYHLVCGPMIKNPCCSYVQQVVHELQGEGLNIAYIDMMGILTFPEDYGCAGHPNVIGHQKMAKIAIAALSSRN